MRQRGRFMNPTAMSIAGRLHKKYGVRKSELYILANDLLSVGCTGVEQSLETLCINVQGTSSSLREAIDRAYSD